jgi:site-specific DNA-methyltransferase (adenine-specific)
MKTIPDKWFDLSIVDPPYGIHVTKMSMGSGGGLLKQDSTVKKLRESRLKGSGKLKDRILNQMSCDWDFNPPEKDYFDELFRVSKNQIIWGGNYFNLPPTRCIVCWDKEQIFENFSQIELAWTSFDYPAKLFRYSNGGFRSKDKTKKIHPTQKPIALYAYLLKTFAKPGNRIFDSHLGSGSSRIAAFKLGFDFYATEIDEIYFKEQENRFRRECLDEYKMPNGQTLHQKSLFDQPSIKST